jgi:hypothetical protein
MTRWQPQNTRQGDSEDDSSNMSLDTPPPGRFVVSQGDAVLLNTMDQQRTSAQEWMDLLQQGAASDGGGSSSVDAGGGVFQYYEDSDTRSVEAVFWSEDGDGEAMDVDTST